MTLLRLTTWQVVFSCNMVIVPAVTILAQAQHQRVTGQGAFGAFE